jgi:hypothetical protein
METCTIETGLLRKKPCGAPGVARCATCEQPLCSQHAIAQVTSMGKRTGKFTCKECEAAAKEQQKGLAEAAKRAEAKKKEEIHKAAMAPMQEKKKPAAPAPAEAPKDKPDDSGPIEFTPSKPPENK